MHKCYLCGGRIKQPTSYFTFYFLELNAATNNASLCEACIKNPTASPHHTLLPVYMIISEDFILLKHPN